MRAASATGRAVDETAQALLEHETLSGVALEAVLSTVSRRRSTCIDGRRRGTASRAAGGRVSRRRWRAWRCSLSGRWRACAPAARGRRAGAGGSSSRAPPAGRAVQGRRSARPGDLKFLAPEPRAAGGRGQRDVPRGIFVYDGAGWRTLATVCGGPGRHDADRLGAARPSSGRSPSRAARAQRLGHRAVPLQGRRRWSARISTADDAADPFRQMNAAACRRPTTAGSAGSAPQDPHGRRASARSTCTGTARACATVYDAAGARRSATSRRTAAGSSRPSLVGARARGSRRTPVDLADAGAARRA